jgi:hypothetical protein
MILILGLLLGFSAEAKSYPERLNLYVPVPRSELQIEVPEARDLEPSTFELAYSTWEPSDFRRQDYRGTHGKFEGSFPLLSLNYSSPFLYFSRGASLRAKFGLSYASLERKGLALGRNAEVEQAMNLYMARAGLEIDGPVFASLLQPYGAFTLLPTLGLAGQSELENSVSAFGLPLEASAGLMAKTSWELLGFTQATFGLGAQYIFGTLDGSDLAGWGFQGFVRVGL